MIRKRAHIILVALLVNLSIFADNLSSNSIIIQGGSVLHQDTIEIKIKVSNSENFVAFQMDFPMPDHFSYVDSTLQLNTARVTDHVITGSLIEDTLRIISYSPTNSPFLGDTGLVASLQLVAGSIPQTVNIIPVNAEISDSLGVNILDLVSSSTITLLAPDIYSQQATINFGSVPVGDSADRQFRIYNYGNLPLDISNMIIDSADIKITGNTNLSIPAGSNQLIALRFHSNSKGDYLPKLRIYSDDPDEDSLLIELQAHAYTVNELHAGNMLAHYGDTATLLISLNNQENIVSFQFDLTVYSSMYYVPGSAQLSSRKSDHVISASMLATDYLRVLAYSPTNDTFAGHDGNMLELKFIIQGVQGNYGLHISNGIIGNQIGENVFSAAYSGVLELLAPDISCNTIIDFGEVNILDTAIVSYSIQNIGQDTLKIIKFKYNHKDLYWDDFNFPIIIDPGETATGFISLHDTLWGYNSHNLRIYSNDPDEPITYVALQSDIFRPNYVSLINDTVYFQDTATIFIDVQNYSSFTGFQFDLTHPVFTTPISDSIKLTSRATNHTIHSTIIDSVTFRVFAYSTDLSNFIGDSGSIVRMMFSSDHILAGSYPLVLSNVTLVDTTLTNILFSFENGNLVLTGPLFTTWTGIINSDWGTTENWSSGIPFQESVVTIPASAPNQPVINQNVTLKEIIISPGSYLQISGGFEFKVIGID